MIVIERYALHMLGAPSKIVKREVMDSGKVVYTAELTAGAEYLGYGDTITEALADLDEVIAEWDEIDGMDVMVPIRPFLPGTYGTAPTLEIVVNCDAPDLSRTCWQRLVDWWWRWRFDMWHRLVR